MLFVFLLTNCTQLFNNQSSSLQDSIEYIRSSGKEDPLNSIKKLARLMVDENIKLKHVYESLLCTNQSDIDTKISKYNQTIEDILIYIFYSQVGFKDLQGEMINLYLDIKFKLQNINKKNLDRVMDEIKESIDIWETEWKEMNDLLKENVN